MSERDQIEAAAGVQESSKPFSVVRLARASARAPAKVEPGYAGLEALETRFYPGELCLFAGRTGHGKTSLLVNFLLNGAFAPERPERQGLMLFYSLEAPEVRVFHRLLSLLTVRDREAKAKWTPNRIWDHFRDPDTTPRLLEVEDLEKAVARLKLVESRLMVVYCPTWTAEQIGAHLRQVAQRQRIRVVLVDYLQRIPYRGKFYARRDVQVSEVAREMKSVAVEVGVPIVAAAQLSRRRLPNRYHERILDVGSYGAAKEIIRESRPGLDDISEDGSEQEADLIIGMLNYGADYLTTVTRHGRRELPYVSRIEFGVLKQRYGPIGKWVGMAFEGASGLIRDPRYPEEV